MKKPVYSLLSTFLFITSSFMGQTIWSPLQNQIIMATEKLSKSTSMNGGGADEYEAILSENFTRWTLGNETIEEKKPLVEGIMQWWIQGWKLLQVNISLVEK